MAETSCDSKTAIQKKLISIFGENPETLARIFFYLDEEDKTYKDSHALPPVWKTLKLCLPRDKLFQNYAERLAEDTKRAEKDVAFRKTMNLFYSEILKPSEESAPKGYGQEFDLDRLVDLRVAESAFTGLAQTWDQIPLAIQTNILKSIPRIINNNQVITYADKAVGFAKSAKGAIVLVSLAAIKLGFDAIYSLYRWWKGEISGKRCAKNIIDSIFTISAGVAGGIGGAALGSLAGPVGFIAGGFLCGIVSYRTMSLLCDRVTQGLFDLPKSEALEKAYRYLGVSMTASNHEINTAFHKLCLKHHPDKPGGNTEEFLFLQLHMGTIKAAREEM